ncbi:diguanylate cyclase [Planctomycetota bacterium]|nr:diguanylate cyclase [Planctomycetota bacterium]
MPNNPENSWRLTYLLGVALLLPIGTVVLVAYYFTRMNPFEHGTGPNAWAFSIIAVCGGLSALMATLLAIFCSATYRARVKYENEYRQLQRYLNQDVARERSRMQRNLDLVSAAQQVSMAIKQEVDFERILSVVLEQLEHFAGSDSICIYTTDSTGNILPRAERRSGVDFFPPVLQPEAVQCDLVSEAMVFGRQMRRLNETTGEYLLASYFSTPDGVRGVARIARNISDDSEFQEEMPGYEQGVNQLVRMVSLGMKTANIWDRAIKDEKTGLFNANHYGDQLQKQTKLAQRTGRPLSIIMMDIDKFKHVNDTYGHLAGDTVLAEVAKILIREARETDTPYRYGGEELCVICEGTTEQDAALAAERLRQQIAVTEFFDERGRLLPISASFGVVEYDTTKHAHEKDLKEDVDKALYQGKENGRNVVVVAEGNEKFRILKRTGDYKTEVKVRMGLAGDNSPLKTTRKKTGKIKDKCAQSAREQLGESIDALATGIAEVVGEDSSRAKVVDNVVREATEFLTKNLSTRLNNPELSESLLQESKPKKKATSKKTAAKKPAKKKATPKKKATTKTTAEPLEVAEPEALKNENAEEKPKRKRAPRKKAAVKTDKAVEKAAVKPIPKRKKAVRKTKAELALEQVETEAEAELSADSDRLDYLTEGEGQELTEGRAPSKRSRRLNIED